jgi:hypothetical protein
VGVPVDVVARPSSGDGLTPSNEGPTAVEAAASAAPKSRDPPEDKPTLRFRNDIDCSNVDKKVMRVKSFGNVRE